MDVDTDTLSHLNAEELRDMVQSLRKTVTFKQAAIDKLTHESALLKRLKFAAQSERFNAEQRSLLEETLDEGLQAVSDEIAQLSTDNKPTRVKVRPKRQSLPVHLPRIDILHEPDSTTCRCGCQMKRVGVEVAEKLDYRPGVFSVERHVRGKWACAHYETWYRPPCPAHIIDKGIPNTGLLAQVLVSKFADHLPLYRQEAIFGRAGLAIPRSTLGAWGGSCGVQFQALVDALKEDILRHRMVHADETPVQMLQPGHGKTHQAYLWAYATGAFEDTKAAVYDFCASRAGENAKAFLGEWRGHLVCDGFSGYKQLVAQGVTVVGGLAHYLERQKSQVAQATLEQFGRVNEIEREVRECSSEERQRVRQERSKPLMDALHVWLLMTRQKITDGGATAKALDYCLRRRDTLTRFLSDGQLPVDNNHIENQIRPIAMTCS